MRKLKTTIASLLLSVILTLTFTPFTETATSADTTQYNNPPIICMPNDNLPSNDWPK